MAHVLAVSGSPMEVSRSAVLLGHVTGLLTAQGHTVDVLRIRDLPAQALLHAEFGDPAIVDATARLDRADGVVVATPVYKAAFSGLLKTWLDLMPQFGLAGKAVLPLATGGSVAHALALDYALRPVLTSMEARHVVNGFLVLDRFIESPTPLEPSPLDAPVNIDAQAAPALSRVVEAFLEALEGSSRLRRPQPAA
ncbi:NADPH-dependent FMN reductase [Marmoricola sp. RAF53]|uniref:NADPH-dependent FMN reductase n=1 Tax=Marmoricola sp. RAF53 TaxID=3233059 RepID=UPI003F9E629C